MYRSFESFEENRRNILEMIRNRILQQFKNIIQFDRF